MLLRICFFLCTAAALKGQTVALNASNLPLIFIDTEGKDIPNEPKISARMKIIDNGPNRLNRPEDAPNGYDGYIGIELRGSTSLILSDKKPYGFETRDAAGANRNVSLLGMPKENDWVLLAPFSDKTLMRDILAFELAARFDAMAFAPRARFVEVFVNGRYDGVYVLTERIKRDKNRVDIDKSDEEDPIGGYILKLDKESEPNSSWQSHVAPIGGRAGQSIRYLYHYPEPTVITQQQKDYIKNYMYRFDEALKAPDLSNPNSVYRSMCEVSSFIDYMLHTELTRNIDGYRISAYFYKDSDKKDGRLKMGPVWDFNLAFGNANYCSGQSTGGWAWDFNQTCPEDYWLIPSWWHQMRRDTQFLIETMGRWSDLRRTTLSDEAVGGLIDAYKNLLFSQEAVRRNFERWPIIGIPVWPNAYVGPSWDAEVAYLKSWVLDRLKWMDASVSVLYVGTYFPEQYFKPRVFPNPSAKGTVYFDFYQRYRDQIQIVVYDMTGRIVAHPRTESNRNGRYRFAWTHNLSPGAYYFQVRAGAAAPSGGRLIIL